MNDELTFFTVKAAAKVLQCSERTIRRHIEDGLLGICSKRGKILLIPRQSLVDFLAYRALSGKCGCAIIPKIKDKKIAESVLLTIKRFLIATKDKFNPEKRKNESLSE